MGRPKLIDDETLLAVAREVFIAQGIAASTREIARKAGVSEAVIYQRHPTKSDLFFAAMVPPALDVEALLAVPNTNSDVQAGLEDIALGMLEYFRELVPVLIPLISHPSFDFEKFVQRHPESPLGKLRAGLITYLNELHSRGEIRGDNLRMAGLTLFAALHSLAIFERLGVHGGEFDKEAVRGIVQSLWTGLAPDFA